MLGRHNIFDDYSFEDEKSYICPHCGAFAGMEIVRYRILFRSNMAELVSEEEVRMEQIEEGQSFRIVTCRACDEIQFWLDNEMIYPLASSIEKPNEDMPEEVKELYNEAKNVFELSPRAAAALLRLALQKLCEHLGGKGKNINNDIGALVTKGVPEGIQKALDCVRVVGNNGVHPGEIDLDENKDVARTLFPIMNMIVTKLITEPKKVDEIYNMFPESVKEQINRRDSKE